MDARLQRRVQRYGWDRAAGLYERGWRAQLEPAQSLLLEVADLAPGEEVLDVACGTGLVTLRAVGRVGAHGRVVGVDLSDEMVQRASGISSGKENVEFARMDAEALEFGSSSFDAVLCALGMMYVPDPDIAFQEQWRVLRPGGRAVAAVWGSRSRCGWSGIFPIVDHRVGSEVCPLFFQLGTGDTLGHALRRAGFEGVELRRIQTTLRYGSREEAVEAAFAAGPVALANARFDEATRREADEEYLGSIEAYRRGEGYEIPGEFAVGLGRKPSPSGSRVSS